MTKKLLALLLVTAALYLPGQPLGDFIMKAKTCRSWESHVLSPAICQEEICEMPPILCSGGSQDLRQDSGTWRIKVCTWKLTSFWCWSWRRFKRPLLKRDCEQVSTFWMFQTFVWVPGGPAGIHIWHGKGPSLVPRCNPVLQVLHNDVDKVAKQVLLGVEGALKEKKEEYISNTNLDLQQFAIEVNLVIQ